MTSLSRVGPLVRVCVLLALLVGGVTRVDAQLSVITGTVTTATGEPLSGAHVFVATLATTTESRNDGTFAIRNIPAGLHSLRIYRIGYRPSSVTGVLVESGSEVRVAVKLEPAIVVLDAIVSSVSRRDEIITEAPSAVTKFAGAVIGNSLGSPTTNLLKQAPGIDLTQVGVMSSFSNGRGFNKSFNSRWLTIEDGRIAAFPETGLPIGEHTTIPKLDLASAEVIAGPGSALYGANASGGLMSTTTKDPRQYPGLALEISGGSRSYRDVQARFAGSQGRWGYKIAGQHQAAQDWRDTMRYASPAAGSPAITEVPRDLTTSVTRVAGSISYYMDDRDSRLTLNAGSSVRDALGHSANGRYQIDNYRYNDLQLLFRSPRWFAQAYTTSSNSAGTFRLSTMTYTAAAAPNLSVDSARTLAAFPVDGRIQAFELQNNEIIGAHLHTGIAAVDNGRLTWGAQLRRDRVSSSGLLYTDALSGKPIRFDHRALFVQIESRLAAPLRFIGAARYDTHNRFPSRWSPRVGLLLDVAPEHVLRLTYNEAYLAPSIFQSDLYVVNTAARFASIGNGDGFDIRDASGSLVGSVGAIRPEANQTWELGFKGSIGARLFVDATLYRSRFRDFMTQVSTTVDPFAAAPTYAYNHRTGLRVEDSSGNPLRLFTSVNVGEANFAGLDAALRQELSDRFFLSLSTSLSHVIDIKARPTDPKEATAFNTSAHRSNLWVGYSNAPKSLEVNLRARYAHGYDFRSGVDWGHIPTFATFGLSGSYKLNALKTTLLLQADNIAACVGGFSTLPVAGIGPSQQATYTGRRECGIGVRHHELLNMPALGPTILAGLRREW